MSKTDEFAIKITWRVVSDTRVPRKDAEQFLSFNVDHLHTSFRNLGPDVDNGIRGSLDVKKENGMTSSAVIVFLHPLTLANARKYFKEVVDDWNYKPFQQKLGDVIITNFKITKVAPSA